MRPQLVQFGLGAAQFVCQALDLDVLFGLRLARVHIAHGLASLGGIQAFDLFLGLFQLGQGDVPFDRGAAHLADQQHAPDGPAQQQPEYGNPCQRRPHMCQ